MGLIEYVHVWLLAVGCICLTAWDVNLNKHGKSGVFPNTLSYQRFCFPNWVCKKPNFLTPKTWNQEGSAEDCKPLVGLGQSPGWVPGGEAPGSSAYLGFENS